MQTQQSPFFMTSVFDVFAFGQKGPDEKVFKMLSKKNPGNLEITIYPRKRCSAPMGHTRRRLII